MYSTAHYYLNISINSKELAAVHRVIVLASNEQARMKGISLRQVLCLNGLIGRIVTHH